MPAAHQSCTSHPVSLAQKASLIEQQWCQRVAAEMNDYQFKVVRIEGEFIWHSHPKTDEAFFVLDGILRINLPEGAFMFTPVSCTLYPVAKSTEQLRREARNC